MYIPKQYGQSKISKCPFCGKNAYFHNRQNVPVCKEHKENRINDMKCACGSWLEMKQGKYGVFFVCLSCGPLSMRKVIDINTPGMCYKIQRKSISAESQKPSILSQDSFQKINLKQKKEITLTSEELDFI